MALCAVPPLAGICKTGSPAKVNAIVAGMVYEGVEGIYTCDFVNDKKAVATTAGLARWANSVAFLCNCWGDWPRLQHGAAHLPLATLEAAPPTAVCPAFFATARRKTRQHGREGLRGFTAGSAGPF